jgi:hypothetical protein
MCRRVIRDDEADESAVTVREKPPFNSEITSEASHVRCR